MVAHSSRPAKSKKSIYCIGGLFGFLITFTIIFSISRKAWNDYRINVLIQKEVQDYVTENLDQLEYPYANIEFIQQKSCMTWGAFGGTKVRDCYVYEFDIHLEDGNLNHLSIEYSDNKPQDFAGKSKAIDDYKIYSNIVENYFNYEYEQIIQNLGESVMKVKMPGDFSEYLDIAFLDNLAILSEEIGKIKSLYHDEIQIFFKDSYKVKVSKPYGKGYFMVYGPNDLTFSDSKGFPQSYYYEDNPENLQEITERITAR